MNPAAQRTLRLVSRSAVDERTQPTVDPFEAPALAARPADRCERWPVENAEFLQLLAAEAASCRLSLPLATVLVVERTLLSEELIVHGIETFIERLDAQAAQARVRVELSQTLSAYLAALAGSDQAQAAAMPTAFVLPMRLSERVAARQILTRLDASLLGSALAWERAAVLEGRTMSEWAALALLRLCD